MRSKDIRRETQESSVCVALICSPYFRRPDENGGSGGRRENGPFPWRAEYSSLTDHFLMDMVG